MNITHLYTAFSSYVASFSSHPSRQDSLLDEVVASAQMRCVEPVLMEPWLGEASASHGWYMGMMVYG